MLTRIVFATGMMSLVLLGWKTEEALSKPFFLLSVVFYAAELPSASANGTLITLGCGSAGAGYIALLCKKSAVL